MNIKNVKDLIELIKDTDVVELDWTPERIHIIRRSSQYEAAPLRQQDNDRTAASMKEKHTVTGDIPLCAGGRPCSQESGLMCYRGHETYE